MLQTALVTPSVRKALLCMGSSADATTSPAAMRMLNGSPLIYHQAKQLQRFAITDIIIAVESIPPELPVLVERIRSEGLNVQLIRNVAEIETTADDRSAMLVRSTDMWVGDGLLLQMAGASTNTIAILEEHPENRDFERIDLGRRWSGLMVLTPDILARAADIAEGWSLDSCLLRHALQGNAAQISLPQDVVANGTLRKVSAATDLTDLGRVLLSKAESGGFVERFAGRLGARLLPAIWTRPVVRPLVEWGFPALAAISAGLGFAGFATAALGVAVVALVIASIRSQLRHTEYRHEQDDLIAILAFMLLAVMLGFSLFSEGESTFDATLLSSALVGLIAISQSGIPAKWLREISPLLAGLALLAASIAELLVPTTKLALAVIIAAHALAHWRLREKAQS